MSSDSAKAVEELQDLPRSSEGRYEPRRSPEEDLDPAVYNLHGAFWHPTAHRWAATRHGVGCDYRSLRACGCEPCLARADEGHSPTGPPPKIKPASKVEGPRPTGRLPAVEVHERVRSLLASGWSNTGLARAAGVSDMAVRDLATGRFSHVTRRVSEAITLVAERS